MAGEETIGEYYINKKKEVMQVAETTDYMAPY